MLEDIAKCRTMFPFNEFRTPTSAGINVITTLLKPQLGYFTLDIQNMVDDRNSQYAALRDTFELYSNVYRLSDISKLHGLEFQFDLTRWFQSQIDRWLSDLDTKAHDWVQRAIEKDQLSFVSEKLRHSSSIVDLFSFFQQQLNPGFELQWPSPQMKAIFIRDLSKIIMKRIRLYCQIIREKYRERIEKQRNEIIRKTVNVSKYSWSSLLGRNQPSGSTENEFQVLREYCVILNNLAQAESSLFKLWTALDYDPEQDGIGTTSKPQIPPSLTYLVTVVQAQNLQACDFNGLSDPFVILRVGSQDVGQTTVVNETLNPWWEESFQFDVKGTEELSVTVYDKDYMNVDLCGIGLPLKLDPTTYTEYTIREDWVTLVPHGRVLIRSTAFGETEDVEFYFGKSLNIASVTLKDMARLLVYQMHQDISNHVYEIFAHFRGKSATSITTELCDRALHPLLNYLDNNLGNLYENLYDNSWNAVVKELWDDLLDIFENLIFPPLGTNRNPLSETELQVVYRCLELTKVFFNGGSTGSGVNIKELENERYQQLILTEKLFHMSTEELIDSFRAHTNQLQTDRTSQEYKAPEKPIFIMIYHILRVLQMVHKEFNEKFIMKQMEMIAFPNTQS
ncbi:hypothetical protein K493DRAFT_17269 [Basidiobolus meristosporus CBS 931.73]|uniref:C2 domain-containing protein n=1 Tax=Basidiobolus meristosporus CBS 931.73 TaxID=1314790 RepID=A0A1Y1YFU9_9FUNG|nr:hypothetical protein K493DRAFT_17269 [Basidiobolus meristosporus CBS 931.73]|eukprot:ORX96828.1 hypothetical protein K493DRAFT_17269 [Basidiobolus meristosporus CBS 931.73]